MKVRVISMLKPGILDPQGEAVMEGLRSLGHRSCLSVRVGRVVELEVEAVDRAQAEERVRAMCDALLVNPVMEEYRLEWL